MFNPRPDTRLYYLRRRRTGVKLTRSVTVLQRWMSAGPWSAHGLLDLPHQMAVQHHPKKKSDAKKKKNIFFLTLN